MPFATSTVRNHRRAQVRQRWGDAPCSLQITQGCQALGGLIDYDAPFDHPRAYQVDHIVTSVEAERLGWSREQVDALDNLQPVCRECNQAKSDGSRPVASAAPTYINPRFV